MTVARKLLLLAALLSLIHVGFAVLSFNSGLIQEPIPVHWGISLQPDRFVSFEQHLWEMSFLQLGSLGLLTFAAFTKRRLLSGLLTLSGIGIFIILNVVAWAVTLIQISGGTQGFPVFLLLLILVIPISVLALVLRAPTIVIDDLLRIKYGAISFLTLDFSEIEQTEIVELRARDFGGLGIRYSKNKLAFIPRAGKAISLKLKSGESVLVYSQQPEILHTIIQSKLEKS